ncbi:MAG: polysaccharide biosynthesis C-terminal domain-containing protein, partial [Halobacteriaceae archaeon]
GAQVFSILCAAAFVRVAVGPNGATVKAIDLPHLDFKAAFLGFIVNICLNFVLVPKLAGVGAAFATLFGYLVYNGYEMLVVYQKARVHPFNIGTLKALLPIAV